MTTLEVNTQKAYNEEQLALQQKNFMPIESLTIFLPGLNGKKFIDTFIERYDDFIVCLKYNQTCYYYTNYSNLTSFEMSWPYRVSNIVEDFNTFKTNFYSINEIQKIGRKFQVKIAAAEVKKYKVSINAYFLPIACGNTQKWVTGYDNFVVNQLLKKKGVKEENTPLYFVREYPFTLQDILKLVDISEKELNNFDTTTLMSFKNEMPKVASLYKLQKRFSLESKNIIMKDLLLQKSMTYLSSLKEVEKLYNISN